MQCDRGLADTTSGIHVHMISLDCLTACFIFIFVHHSSFLKKGFTFASAAVGGQIRSRRIFYSTEVFSEANVQTTTSLPVIHRATRERNCINYPQGARNELTRVLNLTRCDWLALRFLGQMA